MVAIGASSSVTWVRSESFVVVFTNTTCVKSFFPKNLKSLPSGAESPMSVLRWLKH